MRIQQSSFLLIITAFVLMLFSGCSKVDSPNSPEVASPSNVETLAKNPAEMQQIITYLQQNNIEHAAFFFDVSDLGTGLGIVDVPNQYAAFFFGNYGPGDFLRMNPDGTYSLKIVTNQADATFFDFAAPAPYFGTGSMNYKFSGTGYSIIPGLGIIMFPESSLSAVVLQGRATVTLGGSGVDPHTVHMKYVSTPGGASLLRITLD